MKHNTKAIDKQSLLRALEDPLAKAREIVQGLWEFETGDWVDSITCCDINQDTEPEIIIGSEDGIVYMLSASGTEIWRQEIGDEVTSVLATDLDDDGQIEVLAGSEDGRVYILSGDGELHRTIEVGFRIRSVCSFRDGAQQYIVVGGEGRQLLVLDANGNRQWAFDMPDWVFCAAVGSLADQPMLLVSGRDSRVHALDTEGQLLWTYEAKDWVFSVCIADVDGDGAAEVVVGSRDKSVHVLREDGQLKYEIELHDWVMNVAMADVDNDGHPEIVAGSADGRLTIIDGRGYVKWKFDVGDRMHALACCDVNFDNQIEILVGLDSGLVRVFRLSHYGTLYDQLLVYAEQLNELTRQDLSQGDWQIITALFPDVTLGEPDVVQALSPEELSLHEALESQKRNLIQIWEVPTGDRVRSVYLASTPDGDTRIVVGCDDSYVYLLDGFGQMLWRRKLDGKVRRVLAADMDADGQVEIWAGSETGQLSAFSLDGEELYTYHMPHGIGSLAAADTCGASYLRPVVGLLVQEVYCLDFPGGDVCWSYDTEGWVSGLEAGDVNGCGHAEIVVASNDNHVHFLSADGQLQWKYETGNWTRAVTIGTLSGQDVIVAGSDDHFVHVLDCSGRLLWKYETGNRVRTVQIYDIDLDGEREIVAGSADFRIYVLDGAGNLKWTYDTGGWVRSLVCSDLTNDGRVELVIGSELKRVAAYRVQDPELAEQAVRQSWQNLLSAFRSAEATWERTLDSSSPLIRAYALCQMVADQNTPPQETLEVVERSITDADQEVRQACAGCLSALLHKGVGPEMLNRPIELLANDKAQTVCITLADELAGLAVLNPTLAFNYLAELAKDADRWVRRRVVRRLGQLMEPYPSQTFEILLASASDISTWVQLEVSTALAAFLESYSEAALSYLESIAEAGNESVLAQIATYLEQPAVQTIARTFATLVSEQPTRDIVSALTELNTLLESETQFRNAESVHQWTSTLQGLCEARTVEEVIDLVNRARSLPSPELRFAKRTHQFLHQAGQIADALVQYQRRQALFDRGGYLFEAASRLESVQSFCQEVWAQEAPKACLERSAIELSLSRVRTVITGELTQLRGAADLDIRLGSQQLFKDETAVLTLIVNNIGSAPAENARIQLVNDEDFEIIGPNTLALDFVASHGTAQLEFTVRPTGEQHRFVFDINYDDFVQKGVHLQFADLVRFSEAPSASVPITNPYITGRPIHQAHMFFGRRDTIEKVKSILQKSGQGNVWVLHGGRRFGKTSILYQLQRELAKPLLPVYIDMQGMAGVDTASLLFQISESIRDSIPHEHADNLLPSKSQFDTDPFFTFNKFLDAVETRLPSGSKLVLMIDEFEVLEEKVKSGNIHFDIFGYFRNLMQHRETLDFIFTGTHTLEMLSSNYWSVFFNIALHQRISYLDSAAAEQLISEPVAGQLTYDPLAINKIKTLTANHPYFIQLFCNELVWHCMKRQTSYITVSDVNTVIKEVLESSASHLRYVWNVSSSDEQLILSALAANQKTPDTVVTMADIQQTFETNSIPLDLVKCQHAIRNLIQRDLVQEVTGRGDGFRIIIDLIRLWLYENKAPGHVVALEGVRPTDVDATTSPT